MTPCRPPAVFHLLLHLFLHLSSILPFALSKNNQLGCTVQDAGRHIFCDKQGLGQIPVNLTSVTELKIIEDDIPFIDSVPYPTLVTLHLERNRIRFIKDAAFQTLVQLVTLSLEDNEISSIRKKTFDGLISLQMLILNGNPIYEIRAEVFGGASFPALDILKIEWCSLYVIEPNSFSGLGNLKTISLAGNRLESLPVFGNLPSVTHLNLSDNQIKSLEGKSIVHLASLEYLYLDGNQLTQLTKGSFEAVKKTLSSLHLRGNRISDIEVDSLYPLQKLDTLDLSFNSLVTLNASEPPWQTLKKFLIHDNPWDCGCGNSWMVEELIVRQWNSEANVSCATPTHLTGRGVYSNSTIFTRCHRTDIVLPDHVNMPTLVLGSTAVAVILIVMLGVVVVKRRQNRKFGRKVNGEMTSLAYAKMASSEQFTIDDEHEDL